MTNMIVCNFCPQFHHCEKTICAFAKQHKPVMLRFKNHDVTETYDTWTPKSTGFYLAYQAPSKFCYDCRYITLCKQEQYKLCHIEESKGYEKEGIKV